MHKAIRVEKQLKYRGKHGSFSGTSSKSNRRDNKESSKLKEEAKAKDLVVDTKGNSETPSSTRSHDIKCFKC